MSLLAQRKGHYWCTGENSGRVLSYTEDHWDYSNSSSMIRKYFAVNSLSGSFVRPKVMSMSSRMSWCKSSQLHLLLHRQTFLPALYRIQPDPEMAWEHCHKEESVHLKLPFYCKTMLQDLMTRNWCFDTAQSID